VRLQGVDERRPLVGREDRMEPFERDSVRRLGASGGRHERVDLWLQGRAVDRAGLNVDGDGEHQLFARSACSLVARVGLGGQLLDVTTLLWRERNVTERLANKLDLTVGALRNGRSSGPGNRDGLARSGPSAPKGRHREKKRERKSKADG
jgi:hypothetical protein